MKAIRDYSFTISFVPTESKNFVSITAKHKSLPTVTYDLIKEIKIKKQVSAEKFTSTIKEQMAELISKMNERGAI